MSQPHNNNNNNNNNNKRAAATNSFFTLDDEADLLGLGTYTQPSPAGATTHQQQRSSLHTQQQQQPSWQHQHTQQQQQQPQAALIDLLDGPLAPVPAGAGAAHAAGPAHHEQQQQQQQQPVQWPAQPLPASSSHLQHTQRQQHQQQHQQQHDWPHQLQQHQRQPSMSEVLSLRLGSQTGAVDASGAHRQGSLGYGDHLWLGDEPTEHPIDAPDGADATLLLASSTSGGAAAAGGGRGRPAAVEGVHGGDKHMAEDEYARTVQIQTLSGEGVLTRWQQFLKIAGVRRRRPPGAFAGNELVTSKYNVLNFIPVNLYHQFKRVANMYFAALVCLQAIPGLSPVPWWGTLFPLAVVLMVNGVKEAFDDYWRHKSDETVNHRWVTALKEDGDQRIHWKALQVGDLVRLTNNEDVPADIVLLASSDPEGLCYVETANLDGETNLKVKFCNQQTASFDCAEAFSRAGYFTIDCEAPNPRLYSFEGAICCWDVPPTHKLARGPSPALHPPRQPANGMMAQRNVMQQQQQQQQHAELELAAAGGGGSSSGGWYRAENSQGGQQQQHKQQQQQRPQSPLGRRSGSPLRQRHQQHQQQLQGAGGASLQRPAAAAGVGDGNSLTAALSSYGRQVGLVSRDALDASNLLLRGCTLRKTDWVIGAVVFTGPDTKVVRNMLPAPRKVTRLEQAMNRVVVVVLAVLGSVALCLGVANMVWEVRHKPARDWYLGQQTGWPELSPGVGSWLVQVVRFLILLAQAVPISLYVSLETVKVAQCKLLYDRDLKMYYPPEDVPCTSRTTTLNEELGQVQYVLSDKTGTLTQNVMGFVWASIGGAMYGQMQHAQQAVQHAALQQQQRRRRQAAAAAAASGSNGSNGDPSSKVLLDPQQSAGVGGVGAAAAGVTGGSSKGSAAAARVTSPQMMGSGGGVVIAGSARDGPPPNTPHTIALDPELRQAAMAAVGCYAGSSGSDGGSGAAAAAAAVQDFLLALAVCNTVVPTATDQGYLLYQAASPDEEALVAGAAYLGTKLVARSAAGVEVEVNGALQRLELLAVLEFSSDRKRMSVVVRQHDSDGDDNDHYNSSNSYGSRGRLRLLSKGADNVMLERLKGSKLSARDAAGQQPLLSATSSHLASMAAAGYRTLVVAAKDLDESSFTSWASRYKAACSSSTNRADKVAAVCEELETGLMLLGATAVEDKLQEGVPESIAALSAAGIKVWVLTGDKMETAISIGHTARLLKQHMAILRVKESDLHSTTTTPPPAAAPAAAAGVSPERQQQQQQRQRASSASPAALGVDEHGVPVKDDRVLQAVQRLSERVTALQSGHSSSHNSNSSNPAAADGGVGVGVGAAAGVGLVVDGGALALLLQPQHEDAFLQLAKACDAVICCRVSPMQKAQVATLLKRKAGAVTLAIGDGANDVSMIQAAHIGVGISGREGRAAVQAADFAFGQFRFLVRLLLLHGRQSYLRCREVVLYAFYKNVAYVSCFVLYSWYSGFSAQSVFFPLYIATFNAVWAAFPTLGYGLFEQDVPGELAIAYPQLYNETRCQTASDFYRAWLLWSFIGLWHGLACFYVPLAALARRAAVSHSGTHTTVAGFGTAVMTAVIVTVTLRVAIRTTHWTAINHALIWGTLALWLPFLSVLQALCGSVAGLAPLCGLGQELLGSSRFWLSSVLGAPAAALLLDLALLTFQRQFKPRASQILQEVEAVRAKQRRLGVMGGLTPAAAAAGAAGTTSLQQLPPHSPDLEQQLRLTQQQQQQQGGGLPVSSTPASTAAAGRNQQQQQHRRGGGIFALAHVPSTADAAAAGGGAEEGGSGMGGGGAAAAAYEGWGGAGGVPSYFSVGADYNMGGPHTLGDLAAGIEWAPTLITASPAVLAASQTKRQSALPLHAARTAAAPGAGAGAGLQQVPEAGVAVGGGVSGVTRGRSGLWSVGRSGSGGSDMFGPAVTPAAAGQQAGRSSSGVAIAMQPLPTSTQPAQQQQQQAGPLGPPGAVSSVRARPSRLGQQQQQQGGAAAGASSSSSSTTQQQQQFTLGGDDTL